MAVAPCSDAGAAAHSKGCNHMLKSRITIGRGVAVMARPEVKHDSGRLALTFKLHQTQRTVKLAGAIAPVAVPG